MSKLESGKQRALEPSKLTNIMYTLTSTGVAKVVEPLKLKSIICREQPQPSNVD